MNNRGGGRGGDSSTSVNQAVSMLTRMLQSQWCPLSLKSIKKLLNVCKLLHIMFFHD
ncbi:hypothetical protein HanPSC8_Chr03g0092341 [Helianthus annuus]|nr:hypothetical protein HanPSC8_Chr03g0092341 [Helianthus annuus]